MRQQFAMRAQEPEQRLLPLTRRDRPGQIAVQLLSLPPQGAGTWAQPYFQGAGTLNVAGAGTYIGTRLAQVLRHHETMHFQDGTTYLSPLNLYGTGRTVTTLAPCSARGMHHGGANPLFFDGHSKWIFGIPNTVLSQTAQGEYFRRYFTYSME